MCLSDSLDHLVRSRQHIRRYREADLLGGLEIDRQLELRRLFDGKIAWLRAFENLVHVHGGATEQVGEVRSVGHESPSLLHMLPCVINQRQPVSCREVCDLSSVGKDRWVCHHKSARPFPDGCLESTC